LSYPAEEAGNLIYASLSPIDYSQPHLAADAIKTEDGVTLNSDHRLQTISSPVVSTPNDTSIFPTLEVIKGVMFANINKGNSEESIMTGHSSAP